MPVPSSLADLSTTAASNSPAGSDSIGTSLDDYLRSIQSIIKQGVSKGSDIASASTITPVATSSYFVVTGTTSITAIGETYSWTGRVVVLKFDNTLTLTHSSGLILPGAANISTASGDVASFVNESAGVWRCVHYNNGLAIPYVSPGASGNVLTSNGSAWASSAPSSVPAGTIIDFAGSSAPTGYLACNGAAVSRSTYAALFAAIGTLWGSGDGSTTFNLPNFAAGYAAVQTAGTVGASTIGQMPSHAHSYMGNSAYNSSLSAGAAPVLQNYVATSGTAGSGTDNLAAGRYVLKCVKY